MQTKFLLVAINVSLTNCTHEKSRNIRKSAKAVHVESLHRLVTSCEKLTQTRNP